MDGNAYKMKPREFLRKYSLLILLVIFITLSSILSDKFLESANFMNMLQQSAISGVISIGMTFVIIIGGIDLSVGAIGALAGMITGTLMLADVNILLSIILGLFSGGLIGFINGYISTKFRIPAFIVTMATMTSARGIAMIITNGYPLNGLPDAFNRIGSYKIFGVVPLIGVIWIVLTIVAAFVLRYTKFGRGLFAIGGNQEAARLSGIKTENYSIACYVISGVLAALSGILLVSWLTVAQPTINRSEETNAIAAVVLGGASLSGGVGGVIGTYGGVILMRIIINIFNLMAISPYYQQIFMGIIIILALLMNSVLQLKKIKLAN